jgi:hypothetical protein
MIDLINVDRTARLQLNVVGYQFPDAPTDDWYLVEAKVSHRDRTFHRTDAALEARDLFWLHDWLSDLQNLRLPRFATLSFTEPCLEFDFLARTDSEVRFAITLGHELEPPFRLRQLGHMTSRWKLVFQLSRSKLGNLCDSIKEKAATLPIRDPENLRFLKDRRPTGDKL